MIDTLIQFITLFFIAFQIGINHRSRKIIDTQIDQILALQLQLGKMKNHKCDYELNERVEVLGKLTQIIDQEWKRNECAINMLYLGWQSEEDAVAEVRQ